MQHPITYWYSGQTGGTTGAVSHRQAELLGARPRVNTSPEPDRPHPPASTGSPVLAGRTERESPKPQSPLRTTPGAPAGGRVQNKLMYDDIKYTPGLTGPGRVVCDHASQTSPPPRVSMPSPPMKRPPGQAGPRRVVRDHVSGAPPSPRNSRACRRLSYLSLAACEPDPDGGAAYAGIGQRQRRQPPVP